MVTHGDNTASSSLMVRGARVEVEKKTPGKIVEFDFRREHLRITAAAAALIAVTSAAA
jgi:hypothetical protein